MSRTEQEVYKPEIYTRLEEVDNKISKLEKKLDKAYLYKRNIMSNIMSNIVNSKTLNSYDLRYLLKHTIQGAIETSITIQTMYNTVVTQTSEAITDISIEDNFLQLHSSNLIFCVWDLTTCKIILNSYKREVDLEHGTTYSTVDLSVIEDEAKVNFKFNVGEDYAI